MVSLLILGTVLCGRILKLKISPFLAYFSIPVYIFLYLYIVGGKKTNKLQVHPYKPVSWLPTRQEHFRLYFYIYVFLHIFLVFMVFPPRIVAAVLFENSFPFQHISL